MLLATATLLLFCSPSRTVLFTVSPEGKVSSSTKDALEGRKAFSLSVEYRRSAFALFCSFFFSSL